MRVNTVLIALLSLAACDDDPGGAPGDAAADPTSDAGDVLDAADVAPEADVVSDADLDAEVELGPGGCPAPPEDLPEVTFEEEDRFRRLDGLEYPGLSPHDLTIYLPASYDTDEAARYPVLYMHDGQNLFFPEEAFIGVAWEVDRTIDALVAGGNVPETIVVGVHNNPDRISEYTPDVDPGYPNAGRGPEYTGFLLDLVKPLMDANFRTVCGPSNTAVAGSSLGGLISFYIGLEHPDVFGRIGVISPSLWWNDRSIVSRFEAHDGPLPERLWIDAGHIEGEEVDGLSDVVVDARVARDVALDHGMVLGESLGFYEDLAGRHNEGSWASRLDGILTYLLAEDPTGPEIATLRAGATRPLLALEGAPSHLVVDGDFGDGLWMTLAPADLALSADPTSVATIDEAGRIHAESGGAVVVEATLPGDPPLTTALRLAVIEDGQIPIQFEVSVPDSTPEGETIYLTGSLAALGSWDPAAVALEEVGENLWSVEVDLPFGESFEYKITRGTWETVETAADGSDVENRRGRANRAEPFQVDVEAWADDTPGRDWKSPSRRERWRDSAGVGQVGQVGQI